MEKEKMDKAKLAKSMPKDAQVILSIFNELNVEDYEMRTINQLLEFTYRYVTCVLEDAKMLANHARKKVVDLDDVKVALDEVLDKSFTQPPPREVIAKLAEERNAMPLPPIKPHCGLRLPPDRYCLTAKNYKLRATNPPKKMTKTALEGRSNVKAQVKVGAHSSQAKRQQVMPVKAQVVTIAKPTLKYTQVPKVKPVESKPVEEVLEGVKIEGEIEESIIERDDNEMDFQVVE